jgi:hypothetical protein
MLEAEHIAYIKKALIEMHGEEVIEENWTGTYTPQCWEKDEHHAGAFTMQIFGQQDLYLSAFYQTEFNTVSSARLQRSPTLGCSAPLKVLLEVLSNCFWTWVSWMKPNRSQISGWHASLRFD